MSRLNQPRVRAFFAGESTESKLAAAAAASVQLATADSAPKLRRHVATLLKAVRDRTEVVDLKQVNRVLLQAHVRREHHVS
jgi:hypothetical protein